MRRYLLDTSPLAAFMLGRRRAVETIGPWIANQEVLTSIIVYGEVEEHIKPMANYLALHGTLIRQLDDIKPLAITRQIMGLYADIRLQMRPPRGTGVLSDSDTLIAASAVRYNLTLVTADQRDFRRVPGLNIMILTSK